MTYLLLSTALLLTDWGQTRHIESTDKFSETNPLVGKIGVDNYFIGAIALNATIGYILPKKHRNKFWTAVAFTEVAYVAGNYSIGVKIKL